MGHRIRSFLFFTFALLLATGGRAESQQADIIRGRVIGPDSLPLEGVNVTATTLQGNVARTARTGRDGRYTITHPAGEGDYIMTFAALGYAARRYEIKRLADEEILVADARLTRVNTLETIRVAAERQPPSRNEAVADVGGTEQPVESGVLPAADLGDLAAMAATLPGVQLVPGENGEPNGFSVLGLGADQNMTTLNGMSFGGSSLPRDASVSTSLNTSPYDVSRGGFSGGQLNVRTRGGSNFVMRGTSLNVDAPQLQWTDAAAEALGQTYSNISLGGMASGPVTRNRLFYSSSFQAGRRSNDVQSLLNTGTLGLQTAGVAGGGGEVAGRGGRVAGGASFLCCRCSRQPQHGPGELLRWTRLGACIVDKRSVPFAQRQLQLEQAESAVHPAHHAFVQHGRSIGLDDRHSGAPHGIPQVRAIQRDNSRLERFTKRD
jgi:hypothetical protein